MADGKIDYGKLANKLAGDAGKVTRKGIDFLVGVVKPENIRKVTDGVKTIADSAVEGWKAAGVDDEHEPVSEPTEEKSAEADAKESSEPTETEK